MNLIDKGLNKNKICEYSSLWKGKSSDTLIKWPCHHEHEHTKMCWRYRVNKDKNNYKMIKYQPLDSIKAVLGFNRCSLGQSKSSTNEIWILFKCCNQIQADIK